MLADLPIGSCLWVYSGLMLARKGQDLVEHTSDSACTPYDFISDPITVLISKAHPSPKSRDLPPIPANMSLTVRDKYDLDHSFDIGVTVDESISFIVEALEDPLNPRWCAACIVACMTVIKLDHNIAESLINKNHTFGSSIVAFLTAERSVAEIEALASRWSTCGCSSSDVFGSGLCMRVHRIVVGIVLVLAKLSADPKHRNRANSRFKDKFDVFGTVVKNIAGFVEDAFYQIGPETTVESLVTWSRFMDSAQLCSLLRFFVRICGPMIIPAIVASRSAPKYIVEHGSQVCLDVSNASMDLNEQIDDLAGENFMIEMGSLVSTVNSFLTFPPLLNRDLHFGIAQRAFDFASQAISTIESPIIPQTYASQMKPIINTLASYASVLWTTVPEQMTTLRPCIHSAIRSAMDNLVKPSPPADFANVCKKMKQVYDVGGDYLRREEDRAKFVREMKRAKVEDVVLKEIGIWMCEAYTKLQRKGPFLTTEAREYLSQKEGPRFTTAEIEVQSRQQIQNRDSQQLHRASLSPDQAIVNRNSDTIVQRIARFENCDRPYRIAWQTGENDNIENQ
ncbi:hypothetical protein PILCRDRAFT_796231 [Piloderma croceum F 1598]|uniref:Uncharacterized protein n=1 Tax=Piloderma croceum (strain F 1598) TaxID=765440 RepID=A0A0C3FBF6_PILCF|nr:hypothetical protein PILCRDRAFT_796231 [Piloderma croceum F 1598]